MYDAPSLTRNDTTFAMSSGTPIRRMGTVSATASRNLSTVTPRRSAVASVIAVAMKPGAIAFTLMPNGPSSIASVRVKPWMPAFAERGRRAQIDDLAPPLVGHEPLYRTRAEECAAKVNANHRVPVVLGHLEQQVVPRDAGVVDQDVDATKVVDGGVDRGVDLLAHRYVAVDPDGRAAGLADRGNSVD